MKYRTTWFIQKYKQMRQLRRLFMIREGSLMTQLDESRKTASYFRAENERLKEQLAYNESAQSNKQSCGRYY